MVGMYWKWLEGFGVNWRCVMAARKAAARLLSKCRKCTLYRYKHKVVPVQVPEDHFVNCELSCCKGFSRNCSALSLAQVYAGYFPAWTISPSLFLSFRFSLSLYKPCGEGIGAGKLKELRFWTERKPFSRKVWWESEFGDEGCCVLGQDWGKSPTLSWF